MIFLKFDLSTHLLCFFIQSNNVETNNQQKQLEDLFVLLIQIT